MRLAISGSRSFRHDHHRSVVLSALDVLHSQTPITEILTGDAAGPDRFAADWARTHGVPCHVLCPDWRRYDRRAGLVRDDQIVAGAERLLAFWDGRSRGTAYTIRAARAQRIPVTVYLGCILFSPDGQFSQLHTTPANDSDIRFHKSRIAGSKPHRTEVTPNDNRHRYGRLHN